MNIEKSGLKFEAIIIGAGTAIPVRNHSPASIYLKSKNFNALLDVGPGTFSKLPLYTIDLFKLNSIFISHLHPDHVLDLATYFLIQVNTNDKKKIPINIFGCKGIKKLITQLGKLFPDIAILNPYPNIQELAEESFNIGEIQVRTVFTKHTTNSIAFRFDAPNDSFVYTSDCTYRKELEDFCTDTKVLVSECSYPDNYNTKDHLNAKTLGLLAKNAHVKCLYVTHCYPQALKQNIKKQIQKYYSGLIYIAQDGDFIHA